MSAPLPTTTVRLEARLSDPVTKHEAAALLGISIGSVYQSCREFDAARLLGDVEAMRRHIPCIHRGGVPQANGEIAIEAVMDVQHVANAIVHMAGLPPEANVQFMTVMATKMPFVGRG